MIDFFIGYGLLYIICSFSLNYWINKQDIETKTYFSFLISLILVSILIPFNIFFDAPIDLLIVYFIDTFLGAFLFWKVYKQDFINSLKFASWLMFGLLFLFYFAVLGIGLVIFGIGSLFV